MRRSATPELVRPRLVQRLKAPFQRDLEEGFDNPFSFGGGFKNGGLSDDAMDLLRGVLRFDYMGAAEFEFGAVPKTLSAIAGAAKRYEAMTFTIPLADVPLPSFAPKGSPKPKPLPEGAEATIYVIARPAHHDAITDQIRIWATEGYNRDLKEATRLSTTLRPATEWDGEVVGWLELDNNYAFFTDETMWRNFAKLLGITTP